MMAEWTNSQKLQDEKIHLLQSDLHQERLLRKELEARLDILEEQCKAIFEISTIRKSNLTTDKTTISAAGIKKLNRTSHLTSKTDITTKRDGGVSKFRGLLGHLCRSVDLLLWVGVRRRASCVVRRTSCVVRRALTSFSQELLGQS